MHLTLDTCYPYTEGYTAALVTASAERTAKRAARVYPTSEGVQSKVFSV